MGGGIDGRTGLPVAGPGRGRRVMDLTEIACSSSPSAGAGPDAIFVRIRFESSPAARIKLQLRSNMRDAQARGHRADPKGRNALA